jgi:tRNA threonylcarbamoyladenosine biosynthesis protein TsaB
MRVLALDTTTRAGSVALVEDDRVVEERRGDGARTHAARMPAEITALLDAHRVALADIDLYAVASGPGSFTGLRIGIATIQGLAFVQARQVVAIPALDALAHADSLDAPPGTLVAAWTDAHRGDVFAGLYRVTAAAPFSRERLLGIEGPMVGPPAVTLARWAAQHGTLPERFAGEGAVLYGAVILAAAPSARVVEAPLLAGTIGRLARARRAEAVDPGTVRALYVRRPDAEIARDEKLRVHEIDSKAH